MVWETTQGRALKGAAAGRADVADAVTQARQINAPASAGIYFAVDTEVNDAQISGAIGDYFQAVQDGIGEYIPGAYGNGAVCAACLDRGLTRLAWVWAGQKTHGTAEFTASNRWHIRQHVSIEANSAADTLNVGIGYDPDDFKDDCGAFLLNDAGAVLLGGGVVISGPGGGAKSPGSGTSLGRHFVIARGGLRLRTGPGLAFGVSRTLETGAEVTVLGLEGPNNEWARVDLEDDGLVDGYMFASFLFTSDRADDDEHDHPGGA